MRQRLEQMILHNDLIRRSFINHSIVRVQKSCSQSFITLIYSSSEESRRGGRKKKGFDKGSGWHTIALKRLAVSISQSCTIRSCFRKKG